jgi:phosphate transport system protein
MTNYAEALQDLKKQLLAMAGHAENAVHRAVRALGERDLGLAQKVEEGDHIIDHYEVLIDDAAIHLLAMAPLASDLRFITAAMKISQNLERVGDEASSMARRTLDLGSVPALREDTVIPQMASLSLQMLSESLSAFVERDPARARRVIPSDQEVDGLNRELHRALSSHMVAHPAHVTRCLALMAISRSLERVADHATNIAEDVVYLYEGRDIRHSKNLQA